MFNAMQGKVGGSARAGLDSGNGGERAVAAPVIGKRTLVEQADSSTLEPTMGPGDPMQGMLPRLQLRQGGASAVADLAAQAGSPRGLRATLAANPGLASQIPVYLATTEDNTLDQLMAQAFPVGVTATATEAARAGEGSGPQVEGKNPTDPTVPLPADRTGDKPLSKGQLKWTLKAIDQSQARVDVDFKPDKDKIDAKNVSYLQTIIQQAGADRVYPGGTAADPTKEKARFTPLEDPASKKYIDHLPAVENDPFYGAEWDQAAKRWKNEPGAAIGNSVKGTSSTSAKMNDTPNLGPVARAGKGDASSEFETVPVVLETREPLGALKWGFKIKDAENAPIELTGGQNADCTDAPSADWGAAVTQYYAGKYETILDEFDIGKSDLKPDHKTKLDGVVTKMKANVALNVELGGACDHTGSEAINQALSLKRAETARDYLVSHGIAAARITVQSYSFDWARVEAEKDKSEGKNRRVQVLLR